MVHDDSERRRRLAEALRANLRRRKGQARERIDPPAPDLPESGAATQAEAPDPRD